MSELKAVATYPETMTAHIKQQQLEDAGIPAEVFIHQAGENSFTHVSSASLMVAEQDLERATVFLNSHIPEPEPVSDDTWQVSCPECDSENVTSRASWSSRIADFWMFDLLMLLIRQKRDRHQCNDCGHCWTIWFGRG